MTLRSRSCRCGFSSAGLWQAVMAVRNALNLAPSQLATFRQHHPVPAPFLPSLPQALWISLGRDESELNDPFDINSPENPSFMAW